MAPACIHCTTISRSCVAVMTMAWMVGWLAVICSRRTYYDGYGMVGSAHLPQSGLLLVGAGPDGCRPG